MQPLETTSEKKEREKSYAKMNSKPHTNETKSSTTRTLCVFFFFYSLAGRLHSHTIYITIRSTALAMVPTGTHTQNVQCTHHRYYIRDQYEQPRQHSVMSLALFYALCYIVCCARRPNVMQPIKAIRQPYLLLRQMRHAMGCPAICIARCVCCSNTYRCITMQ